MVAYFIDDPLQVLFGVFPPYWLFKAWWVAVEAGSTWWLYALVGLISNSVLLWWMKRRFERALHRSGASSSRLPVTQGAA